MRLEWSKCLLRCLYRLQSSCIHTGCMRSSDRNHHCEQFLNLLIYMQSMLENLGSLAWHFPSCVVTVWGSNAIFRWYLRVEVEPWANVWWTFGNAQIGFPHVSLWYSFLYHSRKAHKMAITASQARAQLFPLIEQVNEDMKPVVITSKAGNAVLISESEYESMIETAYLLSTPANREWLLDSLAQADRGELIPLQLPLVAKAKKKVAAKKKK